MIDINRYRHVIKTLYPYVYIPTYPIHLSCFQHTFLVQKDISTCFPTETVIPLPCLGYS